MLVCMLLASIPKQRLLPEVELVEQADVRCFEDRVLAFFSLPLVVFEALEGNAAEDQDRRHVGHDHEALCHVRGIPYEARACDRTEQDDGAGDQTEDCQEALARVFLQDELEAAFAVGIVSYQSCEGEERHSPPPRGPQGQVPHDGGLGI